MLNFVTIDFETANFDRNSACSIAVVTVENGHITKNYHSLIKPPKMNFEQRCIDIHGIQPSQVENEPTFDQLWHTIYNEHLKDKIVVAHNARFDIEVLQATLKHYDLDWPDFNYACTVKIARKVWPNIANHRLNTLADMLNIKFHHHQALDDAQTCAKVLIAAAEKFSVNSVDALMQKCDLEYDKFITDPRQIQTSFF